MKQFLLMFAGMSALGVAITLLLIRKSFRKDNVPRTLHEEGIQESREEKTPLFI